MSAAISPSLARWFTIGSGIGISVEGARGAEALQVAAVKVRPSGAATLDELTIPDFLGVPCVEWGAAYASFATKLGLGHKAAVVLLPRTDVILRQLEMPGVSGKDLDGAIQFQLDGLHPWDEDDVYATWARLGDSSTVLVGIARREAVDRYSTLFAEAGIKIAGFSCSAAAIYAALRLLPHAVPEPVLSLVTPMPPVPAAGVEPVSEEAEEPNAEPVAEGEADAAEPSETGQPVSTAVPILPETGPWEIYGESSSKRLLSSTYQVPVERAAMLAAAELRVDAAAKPVPLTELLASSKPLAFAAAMISACPWRALPFNLLPEEARQSGSRVHWMVTGVVGALLAIGAVGLLLLPNWQNARYLESLQAEMERVQPVAAQAAQLDEEIAATQQRTELLTDLRRRTRLDMDVLADLTGRLSPPTWLNELQINRAEVVASGIAQQAAPLVSTLDGSALLEQTSFTTPPRRVQTGEAFRIRMQRSEIAADPVQLAETAAAAAVGNAAVPANANSPSLSNPSASGNSSVPAQQNAAAPAATLGNQTLETQTRETQALETQIRETQSSESQPPQTLTTPTETVEAPARAQTPADPFGGEEPVNPAVRMLPIGPPPGSPLPADPESGGQQ